MVDEKNEDSKTNENEDQKGNNETVNSTEEVQQTEQLLVPEDNRIVSSTDGTKEPTPPFKIVTRGDWGAEPPTRLNPFRGTAQSVRMVFTDSKPCRSKKKCIKVIKNLQRRHIRQGLSDIAYNFLIGGDLRIYEGRGWKEHPGITTSTENYRTCEDIVIAYVGTFDDNIDNPEMADVALELTDYGFTNGLMAGDLASTGGQAPSDNWANTGIDIPGRPEYRYELPDGL